MMEELHQGLRMPRIYQKEDDKVAEYNNDGPTMIKIGLCNVHNQAASQNHQNLIGHAMIEASWPQRPPGLLTIRKEPCLYNNED